jgi:hypothetical protein
MLPDNQEDVSHLVYGHLKAKPGENVRLEGNRLIISDEHPANHYYFASALRSAGMVRTFDINYDAREAVIEFHARYADAVRKAIDAFHNNANEEEPREVWESDPDGWKQAGWKPPSGPSF